MVTKEQRDTELSEGTEATGTAGHDKVVMEKGRGKRLKKSTYPISGRVDLEVLSLVDDAAKRGEMKRGDLVALAVLQFIGEGRADARKIRVDVPDAVRAEVRAAQTASEAEALQLKRLGNNVMPQLQRYWAAENVDNAEVVALMESVNEKLESLMASNAQRAEALRSVLERPEW